MLLLFSLFQSFGTAFASRVRLSDLGAETAHCFKEVFSEQCVESVCLKGDRLCRTLPWRFKLLSSLGHIGIIFVDVSL